MKKYGVFFLIFFSISFNCYAQNVTKVIPQIAVLPFDGRGLTKDENDLLYNQFRGELVNTNAFVVLERGLIESILEEQGFQQSGCTTTECAVEAGKILNVQEMISGIIGKLGSTWTINISLINIENSQVEKSLNRSYKGEIDGLLNVLREIALELVSSTKQMSDTPLYISGISAIASIGIGIFSFIKAENSYDKYKSASTQKDIDSYKADTKSYDAITIGTAIAAGSATLFYFIYKSYYDESKVPPKVIASPYLDRKSIGFAVSINLYE